MGVKHIVLLQLLILELPPLLIKEFPLLILELPLLLCRKVKIKLTSARLSLAILYGLVITTS
jgi:hypothetical protein